MALLMNSIPYALHLGDSREVLKTLPDNSVDSIVCDPPYGLSKEPDMAEVLRHWLAGDDYTATGGGFMGKTWDSFVPGPAVWRECMRVLKPGGHLLAFFGSRTYDMGTLAIRLAGFEIRDQIMWVYGSGFPKSHNLDGEWQGWGTALKPAHEPICVARKPLEGTVASNVLQHGTGALNIDGCRVGNEVRRAAFTSFAACHGNQLGAPGTAEARRGTQGEEKEYVGRWPANLVHDGSDEVLAGFPASAGAAAPVHKRNGDKFRNAYGAFAGNIDEAGSTFHGDTGSAARFFYCAKASRADRNEGFEDPGPKFTHGTTLRKVENTPTTGNNHPTVKPTALMQWLCRLVTPPGGTVLDPFMGSGSTGKAAMHEGFQFIGIDMTPEYVDIARARIQHAHESTQENQRQQLNLFAAE